MAERSSDQVKTFLSVAMERFTQSAEAEAEIRKASLDDYNFSIGEQWPDDIKTQRSNDGKPCLTINRMKQFIHQVTNEQRQQRPSIQVNPVGDGADVDTAEIEQGIIRHIEVNSDAEVAYDIAFDHAVRIGFGWFRVLTDYISEENDDQEILIRPIRNPFTVYDDPACIMPDRSDARYRFVIEDLPIDVYKEKYKDSALASDVSLQSTGDTPAEWLKCDGIRTAEYWYIEELNQIMIRLEDGSLKLYTEVPEGKRPKNARKREMVKRTVKCAKINAIEILEEYTWEGKWIPIVPVLGTDLEVNGKRHLSGLVRDAKDAQRAFNYWTTAATEAIALAPKAPWLIEEGQIEGHEVEWSQSNVRNTAVLVYKGHSVAGTPAPPPERIVAEPPIQAMVLMVAQADNNLKSTTGINAATLGEPESERSGKAVLLRQKQSDIATLNFTDNLARSIRHLGRILIDLIPKIYDAPRVQRIIAPDQTVSTVGIFNSQNPDTPDESKVPEMPGISKIYDVGVGNYDVTISVGPSYQSKRQEAAATMLELFKSDPAIVPIMGDILLRNMDFPGAQECADRAKKMLPPQLQDEDDQADPEVQLQQKNSQLQALTQQHEQLTQALQHEIQLRETKQVEMQNKFDVAQMQESYRQETEKLKIEGQTAIAEINTKFQETQARLKLEYDLFQKLHVSSHERAMQSDQQQADLTKQGMQQGHEQQMQGADQAHQQDMASQQQGVDMTMAEQQQPQQGAD
jgi:hypothetical protein